MLQRTDTAKFLKQRSLKVIYLQAREEEHTSQQPVYAAKFIALTRPNQGNLAEQ